MAKRRREKEKDKESTDDKDDEAVQVIDGRRVIALLGNDRDEQQRQFDLQWLPFMDQRNLSTQVFKQNAHNSSLRVVLTQRNYNTIGFIAYLSW
jgi:hypothetical protein